MFQKRFIRDTISEEMMKRNIICLVLTLILITIKICWLLTIPKPKEENNFDEVRPEGFLSETDDKTDNSTQRPEFSALSEQLIHMKRFVREDLNIKPENRTDDTCVVGAWNDVSTEVLPMTKHFEKWKSDCGNCVTSEDGEMRVLSAFVYDDHIAVVTSLLKMKQYRQTMYCHYFDCNRRFIGTYESILFPLATVRCVRRIGADFISLSFNITDIPADPIPIVSRIGKPKHDIGVCGGQLYGQVLRVINLIEFIEHHRLIGASFFYMTIFDIEEPMYRVIHEYERLGLLDPFWVNLEIKHVSPRFHMIQTTDCYYRSRMHSKWTINIDHDERLIMRNPSSLSQLLVKLPANVASISFSISRIPITEEVWHNSTSILFETYTNISRPIWLNHKSITQQAYTHFPFYHWNCRMNTGRRALTFNSTVGYLRHYRISLDNYMSGNWKDAYGPYLKSNLSSKFSTTLRARILTRYKYLFDQRYIRCETVAPEFLKDFFRRDKCVFSNGTTVNIE